MKLYENFINDGTLTNFYGGKTDSGFKLQINGEQTQAEQLPTKWFKTEEIETWIGESLSTQDKEIEELNGGKGRLIVLHQCGENKNELISQLETLIYGLKEGFENFAN
jgi:hypothetical protein